MNCSGGGGEAAEGGETSLLDERLVFWLLVTEVRNDHNIYDANGIGQSIIQTFVSACSVLHNRLYLNT